MRSDSSWTRLLGLVLAALLVSSAAESEVKTPTEPQACLMEVQWEKVGFGADKVDIWLEADGDQRLRADAENDGSQLVALPNPSEEKKVRIRVVAGDTEVSSNGFTLQPFDSCILVVRHAEDVQDGSTDPPLTSRGRDRADELARILVLDKIGARLGAVYSTAWTRAKETAEPAVRSSGLASVTRYADVQDLKQLPNGRSGDRILIVGHGGRKPSVPAIVRALGGGDIPIIPDGDHSRFELLVRQGGTVTHSSFRYGEEPDSARRISGTTPTPSASVPASTLDADQLCNPTTTTLEQIVVDLLTGEVDGSRKYAVDDEVRLLFKNKNPFAFEYQIVVDAQPIEEQALGPFTSLFPGVEEKAPVSETKADKEDKEGDASPGGPRAAAESCTGESVRNFAKPRLEGPASRLDTAHTALSAPHDRLTEALEKTQEQIAALTARLQSPTRACRELVVDAELLLALLEGGQLKTAAAALQPLQRDHRDRIGVLRQELNTVRSELRGPDCSAEAIAAGTAEFTARLSVHEARSERVEKTLKATESALTEMAKLRKAHLETLTTPGAFYETRTVGPFDTLHRVKITVKRKKRGEKSFPATPFVAATLSFGGRQRFALAVGAAASTLNTQEFQAVQGFELDRAGKRVLRDAEGNIDPDNGQPNLTRVVAVEEDSDNRIAPLVILHTRISEGFWKVFSGLHLSFGLTGNLNESIDVEYLAGLSVSFAEERYFFTVGAYNGRFKTLEGDFYPGAALPEAVAEIPVRKDRTWDFGVAFSIKVR